MRQGLLEVFWPAPINYTKEILGMLMPTWYATHEGGQLFEWIFGEVDPKDLDQRDEQLVAINSKPVHSLYFGDITKDNCQRWDCINGWTKPGSMKEIQP
jgi:hypothetical protein